MSGPTAYTVSYSFSGFQANNPTTPLPASKLDNELAAIATSVASIILGLADVRRSDGALKNGVVTFDSLAPALQFLVDPTNGEAVAAAVAGAQAAATSAAASNVSAAGHETNAAASAAAAAASAGSVNLTNFLSKAGNLAGIGSADTARSNINAMNRDGSDATGRLGLSAGLDVADYNAVTSSGYYSSTPGAANAPDAISYWLVHVLVADSTANYITQIAYQFVGAATSADSVLVYKRYSYASGGSRAWTPWISGGGTPVGAIMNFATTAAPPGFLKLNGALLLRAEYPALWNHANNSGNIVAEGSWSVSNGAFSAGDLVSTFRIPDLRGEFIRGWDGGRGVDAGRVIGSFQADLLKDHTHNGNINSSLPNQTGGGNLALNTGQSTQATGGVNGGLGGAETRPRNIALLPCIKT